MVTAKKSFNIRLKLTLIIMTVVLILFSLGFAWYSFYTKHADTKKMEIMTPYSLFLLNSGASDSLELSVGGIHPGETKQVIVCVSSHDANQQDQTREGEFPYTLEFVHTENIGLTYKLYELTALGETKPADGTENVIESEYTVVENSTQTIKTAYFQKDTDELQYEDDSSLTEKYQREMYGESTELSAIVNVGRYCIYEKDNENNYFHLSLSGDADERYNYFLIEITWTVEGIQEKSKETDLVYLVAKAGVPKPAEITNDN